MLAVARRHPWLALAFVLAAAAALWALVDLAGNAFDPAGEPEVRPWMTVGAVGRAWDLDPRAIDALAGLPTPEEAGRPLTIREIAERRGVPEEEVVREVEDAIRALREGERGGGGGQGGGGGGP